MRTLVTGGAGFVGSTLVDRLLAEGHQVDVIDNLSSGSLANLSGARRAVGEVTFHQVDVRSPEVIDLVARRHPEVVFHLAALTSVAASFDNPALDADVNIVGTLRVAEAARAAGSRKLVVTSNASAVYGDASGSELPIAEHRARRPVSPHGLAKHAVDGYLVALRQSSGLDFTSLVLGSVYGPRDSLGVVGTWSRQLLAGQACVVHGDGSQTRDFVFVDDVVDALARSADRADGLMLNVGSGVETSLSALHAALIAAYTARRVELSETARTLLGGPARAFEPRRSVLDVSRAGAHLDWRPWTSLSQGLAAVVDVALSEVTPASDG